MGPGPLQRRAEEIWDDSLDASEDQPFRAAGLLAFCVLGLMAIAVNEGVLPKPRLMKHDGAQVVLPPKADASSPGNGSRILSRATIAHTGSMKPTMWGGEQVLVWEIQYDKLGRGPKRGDVVTFWALIDGRRQGLIKRIVGVPGDTVARSAGALWINGAPVARIPLAVRWARMHGRRFRVTEFRETLPAGGTYHTFEFSDHVGLKELGPYVIQENSYFVMGDNRPGSMDSRDTRIGPVPRENLEGVVRGFTDWIGVGN